MIEHGGNRSTFFHLRARPIEISEYVTQLRFNINKIKISGLVGPFR